VVDAHDLDHEPLLVVDPPAPQTHDVITSCFNRLGASDLGDPVRPRSNVFDMVAIGSGIGWLNTWQAEREAGRTDVAIRPLQPIGMWDEFRVAWRAGDTRPETAACVRVVLETCASERSG
jgi:DNA-binding transcriptional LysR family regulator